LSDDNALSLWRGVDFLSLLISVSCISVHSSFKLPSFSIIGLTVPHSGILISLCTIQNKGLHSSLTGTTISVRLDVHLQFQAKLHSNHILPCASHPIPSKIIEALIVRRVLLDANLIHHTSAIWQAGSSLSLLGTQVVDGIDLELRLLILNFEFQNILLPSAYSTVKLTSKLSHDIMDGTINRMVSQNKRKRDTCAIYVHAGAGHHSHMNERIHLLACNE
jgi:hypothetical protein